MKKIITILSLCAMLFAVACNDDDYGPTIYEYAAINSADTPESATEDDADGISIPVVYGGRLSNPSSFTVNYSITGGTYGTDYTVVDGNGASGSVTIPAGADPETAIQIIGVPDLDLEDNVELTVTLSATSNGLAIGYPGVSTVTVTLEDDDCLYEEETYVATAGGHEYYSDGSEYPDGAPDYPVGFTLTGEHEFTMDNYWGSNYEVKLTIDPATLVITVPAQTLTDGSTVVGTGKLSTCSRIMTIQTVLVNGGSTYDFKNTYTFPE
ncbi:MAG: hypothetical protein ABI477_19900 [Chryseolinea sp.]